MEAGTSFSTYTGSSLVFSCPGRDIEKKTSGPKEALYFLNEEFYSLGMITEWIRKHEEWRLSGLNLIASENRPSRQVLSALSSDLGGRYGTEWYGGSRYARELCYEVESLAKKVFKAQYAFITPLSGNLCDLAVLFGLTQEGDTVAAVAKEDGGYPLGFQKFHRSLSPLPVQEGEIDGLAVQTHSGKVKLTILGASVLVFPQPVSLFAKETWGTLAYDGSHVLGLIAGGEFQDPLGEGADILMGSTHKSFPGPQGGIIMTNSPHVADILENILCFSFENGIGLVDNPHLHRIAALGVTLQEMMGEGRKYARLTINNARALAHALDTRGVPVKYRIKGYTRSHQILLDLDPREAHQMCQRLENHKIFIDISGRIGVAEVSHMGMMEQEMDTIADVITRVYRGEHGAGITEDVERLSRTFTP